MVLWGCVGELSSVTAAETLSTEKCPRARSLAVARGRNLDQVEVVVAGVTGSSRGPLQALGDLVQALCLLHPSGLLVSAVVRVSLRSLLLRQALHLEGTMAVPNPKPKPKLRRILLFSRHV